MMSRPAAQLPILERSQAAEARRIAMQFAQSAGFNEADRGRIGVVVTEAANNLVKHSRSGEILLGTFGRSLHMLAIDRGPGMDLDKCFRDGFSTAGTTGTGLGAIRRMSDQFDAFSDSSGTVLFAGFGEEATGIGWAQAPKRGEQKCGDSWTVVSRNGARWTLVVDGLGHGEFAAAAAVQAVKVFESGPLESVAMIVDDLHRGLRSTRGAAVAVAELRENIVNFCGLGNIGAVIKSGVASIQMVSMNGTAGAEARKINPFQYKWGEGSILVMYSDGLLTQWSLDRYPGLLRRHPSVIAGILYRDYSRGRDDVTVLVVRR